MPKGQIIKALSGYYYVRDDAEKVWQCRARGVFKKKGISPLVGDWVDYDPVGGDEGYVTNVYPRHSELFRPPIANVDLAVLVFSIKEPKLNLNLLDKFLVHAEAAGIDSMICMSKTDLTDDDKQLQEVAQLYKEIGYPVLTTSIEDPQSVEELKQHLVGKVSVFAGQSGVGKSSLLNVIFPDKQLQTGGVSKKLGRGRHTTRHVELLPLEEGGLVADTPGFSQLDFRNVDKESLSHYFREMRERLPDCKFRGCFHVKEPSCAILEAKEAGEIGESRYKHYTQFLEEIKDKKERY